MTEANCHKSHSNSGSTTAHFMSNSTLKIKNETPLATVPSRSSLRFAPVLVIAALMAVCPTLMRADTIAENTGGQNVNNNIAFYQGQSFTTVTVTPESNIAFNFFSDVPATTPYALGTGFLLSMQYLGTPANFV